MNLDHPPELRDFSPESAPEPATTASAVHRILVAEDNPGMLRLLARVLRRDGHEVVLARDGNELMQWLRVVTHWTDPVPLFDLLITDLRMPGYSGQHCLEYLQLIGLHLPVILITAFGDPDVHREALARGARAVLDKPLQLDDLCALVSRTLG